MDAKHERLRARRQNRRIRLELVDDQLREVADRIITKASSGALSKFDASMRRDENGFAGGAPPPGGAGQRGSTFDFSGFDFSDFPGAEGARGSGGRRTESSGGGGFRDRDSGNAAAGGHARQRREPRW